MKPRSADTLCQFLGLRTLQGDTSEGLAYPKAIKNGEPELSW